MGEEERTRRLREELFLPDDVIAVNAGSWGPLCRAAREAIAKGYEDEAGSRGENPERMRETGSGLQRYEETIGKSKNVLAGFLNCALGEVALCDSSTTGMNIFLWGYGWEPDDEIVAGSLENPAAMVPLRVLSKRRGVRLVLADQGEGDVDSTSAIENALSEKTKMILISDVNYATGTRVDLEETSRIAHEKGILVLADGIQAVGTRRVDVKELGVDGYAMGRHKFLCGPDGAGALYVSEEALPEIDPTYSGVFSASDHGMGEKLSLMETAQRYEVSTRPLPVIEGGTACVQWLHDEVGFPWIFERSHRLYNALWDALDEIPGVNLVSPKDQRSLLTFTIDGVPARDVASRLIGKNIFVRTISAIDPPGVRLSIGFWNRESDLKAIEEIVREIARD